MKKTLLSGITCIFLFMIVFPNGSIASSEDKLEIYQGSLMNKKVNNTPRKDYKKSDGERSLAKSDGGIALKEVNDRRILVKVIEGKNFSATNLGVTLLSTNTVMKEHNYVLVRIPEVDDFSEKLKEIKEDPSVAFAEPDYIRENSYVPADPGFKDQWYLNQIDMSKAWEVEKGSTEIQVAVLDTGVNAEHPDLSGRLLPGYDFVNNDKDPSDDNGHGTFVSGIIAANANGKGIVGIDLNVKILPVKVSNSSGKLSTENIAKGIYYAINQGADIINMSFGSDQPSVVEEEAIWEAYNAGIVLVAAAGNETTSEFSYPASYTPVISVAATGEHDSIADFSNYGQFIDISAPGEQIFSTLSTGGYGTSAGTSFSTPIISGLASLLKASHPNWSNDQIEWALEAGSDSLDQAEWNQYSGYGRVNAYNALTMDLPSWEEDSSNKRSQASTLSNDHSQQDKIDFPMDEDWFRIKVDQNSTVTVTINNSSDTLDLVASLYDAAGQIHNIDDGGIGEGEHYSFQAEKGEYFVYLFDYYNHWSDSAYDIQVSIEGNDQVKTNYSDVTLYTKEINFLTDRRIIRGFPDGTFKPQRGVTRLQAVQMILNEMDIDVEETNAPNPDFSDVTTETYGYKAIAKAVELGFIKGKDDGSFDPSGSLTRAQMAAILVAAYDLQGTYNGSFTDVPRGHWAYEIVSILAANNITVGYPDNIFKPAKTVTREHFSVFLYNYLTGSMEE